MTQTVIVEWVDEIPGRFHSSPYDEVAEQVRKTGKVARIATTKNSLHSLANRLRERYKDLTVAARTINANKGNKSTSEYYVYLGVAPTEEEK